MKDTLIVGLDCSTNATRVGLAKARAGESLHVEVARLGTSDIDIVDTLVDWLGSHEQAVLAIDAPLGWPAPLSDNLIMHEAGNPLPCDANHLFRRETDRNIRERLAKQSLDVGADRIARTAHKALQLLAALRHRVPIDMGWTPGNVVARQAIEVYPAATLKFLELAPPSYKAADATAKRSRMLMHLHQVSFDSNAQANATSSHDVLDAIICAVAGFDYLKGLAVSPTDLRLAKREGWIWCR